MVRFYSRIGDREWESLENSAYERMLFELSAEIVRPHLGPGKHVLDAGCGGGRFSVLGAGAGSQVTLLDLCPEQVDRAGKTLRERGFGCQIEAETVGDVRDLSMFRNGSFDTVLCMGAVLSYLGHHAAEGLSEVIRVTREGGGIVVGVLSLFGALRFSLASEASDLQALLEAAEDMFTGGDTGLPTRSDTPSMHYFTASNLGTLLAEAGLPGWQITSVPTLSTGLKPRIERIATSPREWARLLDLERQARLAPGLLDAGEHLLAEIYPVPPPQSHAAPKRNGRE